MAFLIILRPNSNPFLSTTSDGRIAPRSGLASKHYIDTGAGVIDADYRGQVKVLLFNHSDVDFAVNEGDRVAQLVLERIYTPEVLEVAELEESVRGAGGFGSTGGFGAAEISTVSLDGASDAPNGAAAAATAAAVVRAATVTGNGGEEAKIDVEMKNGGEQKPSS